MEISRWRVELPPILNALCHEVRVNDAVIEWVDIVFEQIGNASKCPPHSHTWFEFNYLFVGEMKTRFADRLVTINAGDFFLIPPGLVHSHVYRSGQPHEGICIRWRTRPAEPANDSASQDTDTDSQEENSLFRRLYNLHRWKADGYRDEYGIKEILFGLFAEAGSASGRSLLSMQLQLVRLLEVLVRISSAKKADNVNANDSSDSLIRKVEVYFEDYQGEHINVTELAASLHMSYGHLCRIYKQRTGMTLIQRMNRIRLDKACALLADSSISVKEAAQLSGFPDIYYFCKAFKKYFGISPAAYRKQEAVKMQTDRLPE